LLPPQPARRRAAAPQAGGTIRSEGLFILKEGRVFKLRYVETEVQSIEEL
jgi:hypothetical protein